MLNIIFAAAVAVAAPVPTTAMCAQVTARIEDLQKDMATNVTEALADDGSAPRATKRAAENTAAFTEAGLLFRQLELNHCAPYPHVVSGSRYLLGALTCHNAEHNFKEGDKLDECKKADWKAGD